MIPSSRSAFIGSPLPLFPSPQLPYLARTRLRACAASAPLDKLLNVARHQLSRTGLEITSMTWESRVLTIYIKRENGDGVSADDCADVSTFVGRVIEQGSYLGDDAYTMQVSTPGTTDMLTQQHELEAFQGFPVHVRTTEVVNGKKEFWGTLAECTEELIQIAIKGRMVKFKRQIVEEIRLCTAQQVQQALGRP